MLVQMTLQPFISNIVCLSESTYTPKGLNDGIDANYEWFEIVLSNVIIKIQLKFAYSHSGSTIYIEIKMLMSAVKYEVLKSETTELNVASPFTTWQWEQSQLLNN